MEFIRYILLYKIIQLVHGFRVIWKLNYTARSTSPYLSVDEIIIFIHILKFNVKYSNGYK